MNLSARFFILSSLMLFIFRGLSANAQTLSSDSTALNPVVNNEKIQIFVQWTDKKIQVDGVLDDAAWQDAQAFEDYFYQHEPLDREPSSEKTRVMVVQDAKNIYIGVMCYDSEPEKIFASSMRRDNNYGSGEVLELLIDTFQDNRNCYAFDTNPLGGKGDAIISDQGNHVNKQWESVIDMDGKRNPRGWAAEFAIPFKSLKYKEGDVVDWNINITREIKHRQEITYLSPIPRDLGHSAKFRGELFAQLRNIKPPKSGVNFQVYPYILTGQTRIYGNSPEEKTELHSGVDFKYDVTTQLAVDLTYKTDFAQAESEEEIVNVTRFNVQRQEKREFFLQSAGLFQFGPGQRTQSNFILFDSRTIGIQDRERLPLLGGGKITGRVGKYSIAALNLEGEKTTLSNGAHQSATNYTAVRLKRNISRNSHIGVMALNQQITSNNYSRAFGVDGIWNVSPYVRFDASAAQAQAPDVDKNNMAGDMGFILNKNWIDMTLRYTQIDSLFNPAMGFVKRANIRSSDAYLTLTKWINNPVVQNVAFSTGLTYITDHHDVLQTREADYFGSIVFKKGDQIKIGAFQTYEFIPYQTYIRNIEIKPGTYNTLTQSVSFITYRARRTNVSANWQWGELFNGQQQSASISGAAMINTHLSIDLAYTYNHLDLQHGELYSHVLTTRWNYSITPDFFTKIYLQWNKADNRFSANFLIDYAFMPRSHVYLVYNENQNTLIKEPTDRILMLKVTLLSQI